MAVVDNRVPTDLIHSIFPGALEVDGVLEPVGRWIERFLCSGAIIARSAFRRKSDPRLTPLALEDCMEILEVGERQSPRLLVGRHYCGDGDEDFPPLGGAKRQKVVRQESQPYRVAALSERNDPMRHRAVGFHLDGLSVVELEGLVTGGGETEWLGSLGSSVGE